MSAETGTRSAGRFTPEAAGGRVSELYERHGRAVYGLCRMLLGDEHEAEDAAQSSFLAAHRALARGGQPRDPGAWLYAIARNECRGRLRSRLSSPQLEGDAALDRLPSLDGDPAQRMADASLRQALAALPMRQREAVVLHDLLGLRSREVGGALGLSLPAVEALLFRARRQLRVRLRPVSGALALPLGLREALAQAIPGFGDGSAATGAAVTSATGIGVLAKLASAPAAAKVAAATVAVTAAGTVVVAENERGVGGATRPSAASVAHRPHRESLRSTAREVAERAALRTRAEDDRSGPSRTERDDALEADKPGRSGGRSGPRGEDGAVAEAGSDDAGSPETRASGSGFEPALEPSSGSDDGAGGGSSGPGPGVAPTSGSSGSGSPGSSGSSGDDGAAATVAAAPAPELESQSSGSSSSGEGPGVESGSSGSSGPGGGGGSSGPDEPRDD
jgi:RNA polymerase sigma-70 factor, ECF subfamily